jgi:hypothetical protein
MLYATQQLTHKKGGLGTCPVPLVQAAVMAEEVTGTHLLPGI